jgi:hypothetical protein
MAETSDQDTGAMLAERLEGLGVTGILIKMAKNGQLLKLVCEMPTCYDPQGREHFDPWPEPRYSSPENRWSPNADHYPLLKMHGGKLTPWNVRLAHVFCNRQDYGWRSRIHAMLKKRPTRSFEEIADALNGKKNVLLPPGAEEWTAEIVRRAYVS